MRGCKSSAGHEFWMQVCRVRRNVLLRCGGEEALYQPWLYLAHEIGQGPNWHRHSKRVTIVCCGAEYSYHLSGRAVDDNSAARAGVNPFPARQRRVFENQKAPGRFALKRAVEP